MPPRVTVLMPVHNAALTLPRALASLERQQFDDWELVAVDDGSDDDSAGVLDRVARTDARLRVLHLPHAGLVAALNTGLASARGAYLARMDADDESTPDRLGAQVALLGAQPDLGLVGGVVEFAGDRIRQAGYALHVDWMNQLTTPDAIALNRFVESPFAHPSVMFRLDLVARHGGYLEGPFPEDYELWLRWLERGVRMAKVPRVLLRWHDSPRRLSRTDSRYSAAAFYDLKARYLARWLAGHVPPHRPLLVWGAGRLTRRRVERLEAHGPTIHGYVDIDPRKIGRTHAGRVVLDPASLPSPADAFVLGYVASRGARDLIRAQLEGRGFREGQDYLMVA